MMVTEVLTFLNATTMRDKTKPSRTPEARQMLKELSNEVKPLVKEGAFDTVNEAVIKLCYMRDGHDEFKKFNQWLNEGKRVKKGEKGFPVWARPKDMKKDEHPDLEDDFSFFPICYLFSNAQVE